VRGVLIGEGLAARLKVKVGAKVRLLVQRVDGEMGAELFRVRGIFHAASPSVDKRRVLVARSTAAEVLGVPGAGHQIVIQLGRAADAAPIAATIRGALVGVVVGGTGGGTPVVETYAEIFPIFQTMESLMDSVMVVAAFFVYLLVGLGIMNTMLMGVLERTREFGVMQALGTRPSGIVALVLAESFWTATLAVAVGLALGLGVTWAGSVTPLLDFRDSIGESVEVGGLAVGTVFRTTFSVVDGLKASLWVYGMALVVGLYPAWHVARLRPVEAFRR
jgi:ABC-type lipoprotein release transport system permease subunit